MPIHLSEDAREVLEVRYLQRDERLCLVYCTGRPWTAVLSNSLKR
jgi:hypothetical protein